MKHGSISPCSLYISISRLLIDFALGRSSLFHLLILQCWPKETLPALIYKAKVSILDGCGAIWKCNHAIENLA